MSEVENVFSGLNQQASIKQLAEEVVAPLRQQILQQAQLIEELKQRVGALEFAAAPKTMYDQITTLGPIARASLGARKK